MIISMYIRFLIFESQRTPCFPLSRCTNSKETEHKENMPLVGCRMNEKLVSSVVISSVFPSLAPLQNMKVI